MFFDIAFFLYGVFCMIAFIGYFYRPNMSNERARNVEFVIPTVANHKTLKSLKEVINRLKTFNLPIWVVVDDKKIEIEGAKVVVVPPNFPGKRCKGRALEFFRLHFTEADKWYCFLDDDSYPLDDNFLYEIPYYEKMGYYGANGILTPRKGKSLTCYILDKIRLWDDMFVYRLCTGLLKRPYIGFHGELLIIKGEALKQISFRDSLVEDFVISKDFVKKGFKTWQSRTMVSIKSPNSLSDFWKQRARWFKGIFVELAKTHPLTLFFVILRLIGGISASLIFFPLWFIFPTKTFLSYFGFFGVAYYASAYLSGCVEAKSIKHFLSIPLLPFMEWISLFYITKVKNFFVIDKN
ncbi:MAG: glycosyltransferase family 2 protein [Nitrososphaerota archaeon]